MEYDMSALTLPELGWNSFFEQQVPETRAAYLPARVSAHFGSQLHLLTAAGEIVIPTQLAEAAGPVAVGDWLLMDSKSRRVQLRLERRTELGRKAAGTGLEHQLIAANIDTLFIVSSCNQDFNLSRLERYLAIALEADAVPVVVLTKADLCDHPNELRRQTEQLHAGLLVEPLDARNSRQVQVLEAWCGVGKTVGLLGSSGVGKSTLANALGAGELATRGIREADGKGRHTTTVRSLHRIRSGGWLLDTPGMRELQLADCEDGVTELFRDVLELAEQCRFRDCSHKGNDGCALQAALEHGELDERRYKNFLKLLSEQAKNAQSLMERRGANRKIGRMYKSVLDHKRKTRGR
jgi:ribosome biogenesis GTPase